MIFNYECLKCHINQVTKTAELMGSDEKTTEEMMRQVLAHISTMDYNKLNPELMAATWGILTDIVGVKDPYKEIKEFYNEHISEMTDRIEALINSTEDRLHTALKVAIAGNIIDFAAAHSFDEDQLYKNIMEIDQRDLGLDHSKSLLDKISKAKTLLYLGDNCGEIVLDKLFIKYIRETYPELEIIFAVRGDTAVNDVTREDAEALNMSEFATVIDNGDNSLGTVLTRVSDDFRKVFDTADVIIAKGQGNFESLYGEPRENLFFLFMIKCEIIAKMVGIDEYEIVCMENTVSK